jgi:23S rRNA (cytosine1962-C5)-methyltransferase
VQASCSARVTADDFFATIQEAVRDGGRRLDEVERTGHAIDHPIGFPEGAYLKALFARVR